MMAVLHTTGRPHDINGTFWWNFTALCPGSAYCLMRHVQRPAASIPVQRSQDLHKCSNLLAKFKNDTVPGRLSEDAVKEKNETSKVRSCAPYPNHVQTGWNTIPGFSSIYPAGFILHGPRLPSLRSYLLARVSSLMLALCWRSPPPD
ncbi:hypothetical protein Q8A67_021458 [Cirrhinus molitorella]|uniref:Uncharacterized protein n=1 Tax=Cirrhinus molitorella TaxID=172907 RepID=A0AA88P3K8_9TELE|nr:hypothetical protein Q8A67_021458 [Cirrhinus molitorella]